jgi:predicted RNase H-like HicB family nuclease
MRRTYKKKKEAVTIPVVVLKTRNCYNAFSPMVDGCAVTAVTIDQALAKIREALEFHLEGERLVKHRRPIATSRALKMAFEDYGTEAVYASIRVSA